VREASSPLEFQTVLKNSMTVGDNFSMQKEKKKKFFVESHADTLTSSRDDENFATAEKFTRE